MKIKYKIVGHKAIPDLQKSSMICVKSIDYSNSKKLCRVVEDMGDKQKTTYYTWTGKYWKLEKVI